MPAKRYYIDTNCISNCLSPRVAGWTEAGLSGFRDELRRAADKAEIVIVGSQFHLEEASRLKGDGRRQWIAFFWDLVRWNILRATFELAKLEATAGGPLRDNEPFDTFRHQQYFKELSLRDPNRFDALALEIQKSTAESGEKYRELREKTKADIAAKFKGKSAYKITQEWWSNAAPTIADWMTDHLRPSQQHLGLPDDTSLWPKPEVLQSAWAIHSYWMARIVMTVGMDKKVKDSDGHDAHHYAMASYTDVLVTQDGDFRDTIALIPNAVSVIDFNTLAAELGVSPS